MHLLGRTDRILCSVCIKPQRVRVTLLAVLSAITAVQLWSTQRLHLFINTVGAANTLPPTLLRLAALLFLAALATQTLQVGTRHRSTQVDCGTTTFLSSSSITSVCSRRSGRCVACAAPPSAMCGGTRRV